MEARARPLCGAASAWGWQGPSGTDRRRPERPLAAQQQPRAEHGHLQSRSRLARPPVSGGRLSRVIRRTAVYGPVRTVVWEGRHREMPPYPDLEAAFSEPPIGRRSYPQSLATGALCGRKSRAEGRDWPKALTTTWAVDLGARRL